MWMGCVWVGMARSPTPTDAQSPTAGDTPEVGTRWEDPLTGDHYAVVDVGLEVVLEPCREGRRRRVDAGAWPRQYVPETPEVDG